MASGELLFISAFAPQAEDAVHGIWKRQQVFVEALRRTFDRFHCLFMVEPEDDDSPHEAGRLAARVEQRWRVPARVTLVRRTPRPRPATWSDHYLRSLWRGPFDSKHRYAGDTAQQQAVATCLAERPAAVFAFELDTMVALSRVDTGGVPVFYDANDLHHLSVARELARTPWRPRLAALYAQLPAQFLIERRCARGATLCFTCSSDDAQRVRRRFGARVEVVPNAVPIPADATPPAPSQTLLFVGFLGYGPNREAAEWFVREVWPNVLARCPQARFVIAGGRPELLAESVGRTPGVQVAGFVADLGALYADTRAVVCPVLGGSGTRVKLMEAAAQGAAIVSTRIGAEGIALGDGRDALLRDDAAGFASACVQLLTDQARAQALGDAARRFAQAQFGFDAVVGALARTLRSTLATSTAADRRALPARVETHD